MLKKKLEPLCSNAAGWSGNLHGLFFINMKREISITETNNTNHLRTLLLSIILKNLKIQPGKIAFTGLIGGLVEKIYEGI